MKASMIFSLVGLVAMTAASPVAIPKRNVATAASTVDDLMSQVQAITAQINKTIAAVPQPVSTADATKIANSIAPQMNQLQSIIAQATASIQSQSKRDVSAQDTGCSGSCLTGKASVLISEISGTIRGVVTCLGVNNVIAIVQPVLTQVTGLLGCLDKIVNGLAQTVGGLLNNLLGGLGLGDLLSSLLGGLLGGLLGNGGLLGGLLGGGSSSGGGGLLGILDANQQA